MSYSISTLLTRNLDWRRRWRILRTRKGIYHGHEEIDRIAGTIRATHLDFRYQIIAEPEETGNGGRVQWVSGRPGEAPAYGGTDFIIEKDGRIAAVYLFFDKLHWVVADLNFILYD